MAEIVAEVAVATELVVTVKFAEDDPAGTVTVDGTTAADELLESEIVAPPAGAAMAKVTVPCEIAPPRTDDGDTLTEAIPACVA